MSLKVGPDSEPSATAELKSEVWPPQARESVYDLLPEPFSDWAAVPSIPKPGVPEDERELFEIAAKLPCRRRGEHALLVSLCCDCC